ncbi:MAG: c-type cytochrome [Pseudohongiellaceae bacterium]|jgi:cytochrome c553
MKEIVIPIAITLICSAAIAVSYSKLDVKGRPGVHTCQGECYDDWVVTETDRKARLTAEQAAASPAELGAKTYTAVCQACHGDKGQGVVGPALTGRDHDYVMEALTAYKNNQTRGQQSALMWGQAATLSAADMENVTAYILTL